MVLVQWTLGYMCLFQFWFPQARCLGVGLLGYMVVLFLIFKGLSILSSIVSVSIYIFTNSARAFPFFHILSSSCCLQTFRWWPFWPVWGDISLCFGFRFSNNEWCWASFHVFVSHLCLLWRNVCLGLFPTFWFGCLFFWYWVVWTAYIFQKNKQSNQKVGKRPKRTFLQRRHRWLTNMKRYSTSLFTRELQIKTAMRCHLTPVRMAIIKKVYKQ